MCGVEDFLSIKRVEMSLNVVLSNLRRIRIETNPNSNLNRTRIRIEPELEPELEPKY